MVAKWLALAADPRRELITSDSVGGGAAAADVVGVGLAVWTGGGRRVDGEPGDLGSQRLRVVSAFGGDLGQRGTDRLGRGHGRRRGELAVVPGRCNCASSSSTAGGAGGELQAGAVIPSTARAAPPASTRRLLKTGLTPGSVRGTATSCHCWAGASDARGVTRG